MSIVGARSCLSNGSRGKTEQEESLATRQSQEMISPRHIPSHDLSPTNLSMDRQVGSLTNGHTGHDALSDVKLNELRNGVLRKHHETISAADGDQEEASDYNQHSPMERRLDQGDPEETVLRLSPAKLYELTSSPKWLPRRTSSRDLNDRNNLDAQNSRERRTMSEVPGREVNHDTTAKDRSQSTSVVATPTYAVEEDPFVLSTQEGPDARHGDSSSTTARAVSTPLLRRRMSSSKAAVSSKLHQLPPARRSKATPLPLRLDGLKSASRTASIEDPEPSPMPQSIPIPPYSLATYLQLELSSQRPSPLYIYRSITSDFPYESSRVKIDRLKNFLFLPPQLEQILWFGALACLDAWLYSFTLLPLRFIKAVSILGRFWCRSVVTEARFVARFIYTGAGRMWQRRLRRESVSGSPATNDFKGQHTTQAPANGIAKSLYADKPDESDYPPWSDVKRKIRRNSVQRHRRTKSMPSNLTQDHKADILKGLLILISCIILMYFDASRMYHGIRGQAAIKLYVIYNVLEVCDRLFSALGQDVLECLFSKESLERGSDGRSKVWRPFWLFILALCYNLVHSTALFYQVITLNVAVNSYSNALLTLLMSNQFVEIKSTVFKKFEKENLFQLTCADVVERFQLWLMLMIIASRNIIETGGLSLGSSGDGQGGESAAASSLGRSGILPKSFTIFPKWTGQIMGPFLLVLGSEMLVDWIKHAYITKFNNTRPAIYGRFLDVLAKDYYSQVFVDQNLTRRLGLPVIPLACLFIRASVQTYHMFLATHVPLPFPSTATSISLESATASPATTAALQHIDDIVRRALGRSAFGAGDPARLPSSSFWDIDNLIAFTTMAGFFLMLFLALLAFKLVLGMCLLSFARRRYKGMKEREKTSMHAEGRRIGGWGVVEVDEDKRRWIYQDDPEGARKLRERERDVKEKERRVNREGGESFGGISRYAMAAKRIW